MGRNVTVNGGTLLGVPVVVSAGAGSNAIIVDAPAVYLADGGIDLDVSREAMHEMVDTPAAPTAATVSSGLAHHRFEAVHWSTIGAATARDVEILTWANEHRLVVITNDLDFSAILAAGAVDGPSVVQLRTQDLLSESAARIVARAEPSKV